MRRHFLGHFLVVPMFLVPLCTSAVAQSNTGRGAVLGGVAGAVVGGVIGHQNDETPEGALIGGAVGAIAGGVIGHAKDEQVAREQRYQHQVYQERQYRNYQARSAEQARRAVSVSDVINMTRSGIGEGVIASHIETNGVQRRPEVSDVIHMHQQGVSEFVIEAMQRASVVGTTYSYPQGYSTTRTYTSVPGPTYPPGSVIVHEHVAVPPTYSQPRTYYSQPRTYYYPSQSYPSQSYPRRGF